MLGGSISYEIFSLVMFPFISSHHFYQNQGGCGNMLLLHILCRRSKFNGHLISTLNKMLHFEVFIPKLLLFNIFRQFVLQKFILSNTYINVAVHTSIHKIFTDPSTQHIAT